jgi:hypothetical protein
MRDVLFPDCQHKAPQQSRVIITAIPAGQDWRLKAIGPDGAIKLSADLFRNRLEALGACVLVAQRCGARLLP